MLMMTYACDDLDYYEFGYEILLDDVDHDF